MQKLIKIEKCRYVEIYFAFFKYYQDPAKLRINFWKVESVFELLLI